MKVQPLKEMHEESLHVISFLKDIFKKAELPVIPIFPVILNDDSRDNITRETLILFFTLYKKIEPFYLFHPFADNIN